MYHSSHQFKVPGLCSQAGEVRGHLEEDAGSFHAGLFLKETHRLRVDRICVGDGNKVGEGGAAKKLLCLHFSLGCGCLQEALTFDSTHICWPWGECPDIISS